jgi:hypothetical protein
MAPLRWSRMAVVPTLCAVVASIGVVACTPVPAAEPPTPVPAPSASSTPTPVTRPDLRTLLIDQADIPVPGFQPPNTQPLAEDAVDGLVARFDSADGERQLGVTIVVLPDPHAAQDAMQGAASSTLEQRTGARTASAAVGDRAVLFTDYRLAGSSSTLLLFSQGKASVAMEFRSPETDPIPADAVLATGARQASRLKPAFG